MRQIILVAVLAAIIGGCDNSNMDIRKQYPQWPNWGWWDHPAKDDEKVDETKQKKEEDEVAVGRPETVDDRTDVESSKPADAKEKSITPLPDTTITKEQLAEKIELLEQHREKVWRSVSMLREIDSLPLKEQNELRRKILENIDSWYEPMPILPPNTKEPDWTDVVVWDFMPTPIFSQAMNRWKTIAEKKNLKFPENPSRRDLLQYINDYVAGKLKPETTEKQ